MRHPSHIKISMRQQLQMGKKINFGLCNKVSQRTTRNGADLHVIIKEQQYDKNSYRIWLFLKNQKVKIQKSKMCTLHVYYCIAHCMFIKKLKYTTYCKIKFYM